jgi:serine/threonine protein kinase
MRLGELVIAQRYRLLRELGKGGMGTVHLAEDVVTGERLALKLLKEERARDAETVGRFVREARVGQQIGSDHVVRVVDAGAAAELDGVPYLVMELLEGVDLERLVIERGRVPVAQVLALFEEAAEGLGKAHRAGIIHRDLKPQNLFLHRRPDGTETLKILDFGLAKRLDVDPTAPRSPSGIATRTGAVLGTPRYMAPEQTQGKISQIGPWTDVWAMGLVTIRLLTGDHYWGAGEDIVALMLDIVSAPMPPPSARWPFLPEPIDGWFSRSCARDPRSRFPTIGEQCSALVAALAKAAAGEPPQPTPRRFSPLPETDSSTRTIQLSSLPTSTVPSVGEPARRTTKRAWVALGAVALASATCVIALFARSSGREVHAATSPAESVAPRASVEGDASAPAPKPTSAFVPAMP